MKAKCDTLLAYIRELEAAAATRDGEVGVLVQAVRSLNGDAAAFENRANIAEARA